MSSASSSSRGDSSGSAVEAVVPPRYTLTIAPNKVVSLNSTQGSCSRYVAGPDGCALPRSCPDCLLTPGCMIDSSGSCVSQETIAFNESADFREAQKQGLVLPNASSSRASTIQTWEFPAYTTSYCGDSDPICQSCRQAGYWLNSSGPDSRYCIGLDGCVCVANCELNWSYHNLAECITPNGNVNQNSTTSSTGKGFFIWIGVGFLLALLLGCLTLRQTGNFFRSELARRDEVVQTRRRAAQEARSRSRITYVLGIRPLSLSGWIKYRQGLADKENAQLEHSGIPNTPNPTTAYMSVEVADTDLVVAASESALWQHFGESSHHQSGATVS